MGPLRVKIFHIICCIVWHGIARHASLDLDESVWYTNVDVSCGCENVICKASERFRKPFAQFRSCLLVIHPTIPVVLLDLQFHPQRYCSCSTGLCLEPRHPNLCLLWTRCSSLLQNLTAHPTNQWNSFFQRPIELECLKCPQKENE